MTCELIQQADMANAPSLDGAQHKSTMADGEFKVQNICCVGAGYVGGPTAAVIAFQNPRIKVTVADRDSDRILRWQSRHLPIYEPGLRDIVRIARDGSSCDMSSRQRTTAHAESFASNQETPLAKRSANLFFTTDLARSISEADVVLIAVNTPTKAHGIGAGCATDMTAFEAVTSVVAQHAREGAIIVEKSTVPCRTAQFIADTLSIHRPGAHFEILSNPEFLAAGTAVQDLLYPDRVIIGSAPTLSGKKAAAALAKVYAAWVPRKRILTTDVWSSELSKLVANSMLAQRISSINSIAAICEQVGADVDEVARAVGIDPRIGNKFLVAGIGFGGSCFKKDILNLVYLAESIGLPEVGSYWSQVVEMNNFARERFTSRIIKCLNNTLRGKKISILGFAFKKNTSDTREAPALEMMKTLLKERPDEIGVFDPCCNPSVLTKEITAILGPLSDANVVVYGNAYDACRGATALVIATDFDEFRHCSPSKPAAMADGGQNGFDCATKPTSDLCPLSDRSARSGHLKSHCSMAQCTTRMPKGFSTIFNDEPPCPQNCPECISIHGDENEHIGDTTKMRGGPRYKPKNGDRLNWAKIASMLVKPSWVFDGRGVVDSTELKKLGIRVESIGRSERI
ncbi:hypothetical protein MY5147_009847 [Beauveria neobassiana]|uniref:UDP-glucose 6-dehydrogenase n=2 Tax=Beauveria bassiana TaxID=176275 RepID=A0A0A2V9B5_BEABA|nr:UDP-glucose 6-dehydrogenase [Beauveria bassiana D1-5]PQK08616.1 hypothetical protein BB8028_0001g06900 [Beauveria bassiana]